MERNGSQENSQGINMKTKLSAFLTTTVLLHQAHVAYFTIQIERSVNQI